MKGIATTLIAFIVGAAIPLSAGAEPVAAPGGTTYASPQRFAVEARFGPYRPEIDDGLAQTECGGGPYSAVFGDDDRFYFELEFDWQFWRFVAGSFAVGVTAGIFSADGKAFQQGTCTRSEDSTDLWILPLTLQAVFRFDYLANRFSVPLVPYVKFGFAYSFWWTSGPGGVSEQNGESGFGGTPGLRLGGGLMFRLDWIEPRAARTFDNEFGVNHSYLFFEYYWAWVDGFGSDDLMNVGDNNWVLGLALEF